MSRRVARECVLKSLYALEMGGGDVGHIRDTLVRPVVGKNEVHLRFAEQLILRTLEHQVEADHMIVRHAQNWELKRIATVDRILLRMAITELLRFEDIPPKVTINESINLAKQFSSVMSSRFINGILDAVLRELTDAGRLKKSGRGLITSSDGTVHHR